MLYTVKETKRYLKALQKAKQRPQFKLEKLKSVVKQLANGESLSPQHKDHQLKGDMAQFRECHISSDVLLLYYIDNDELILVLVDIGNHSKFFD